MGEGAKNLPSFDLAILDEAHKTTGHGGTSFTYALSDENIHARKHLFLTATPRHIDIRHRDKEGELRVSSMDDEVVYGPRAHTLSFATAAKKGIICPYKVVISFIDKETVDDFARKHGVTILEKDEIATRWMANLIALKQAIDRVGAKKIISFHSRVQLAKDFASQETRGIGFHLTGYDVRHVNGTQNSAERAEVIRSFIDEPRGLLTNARCLTEGVNIPAVDMVAFIDPRQSRIDIAQAVGRAMRKPRGDMTKTLGYVVVPVFAGMGKKDSVEDAIKSEQFDIVADVLNALQEHDEDLIDIIREIKQGKGEGQVFNSKRLVGKIESIGPQIDFDRLTESIGIEIADRIGSNWDEWFGLLVRFKARERHCRVPDKHFEGEFRLGQWVRHQRASDDRLSTERKQRLDAVGFEWDPYATDWERGFAALKGFKASEGSCHVPYKHLDGEFRLGQWATVQRSNREAMPAERKQRLDAIGFEWDPLTAYWEEGFAALEKFKEREGHCRVNQKYCEGSFKLGQWVAVQRRQSETTPAERKQRLDAAGFEWDPLTADWEEGFAALEKFRAREGNCRVSAKYVENTFKLGGWIRQQRSFKDSMLPQRKQRIEAIGFEWDPITADWEEGFAALEKFRAREGHCHISIQHVEGAFKLGNWGRIQRSNREAMPAERKQRLDAIGFVWLSHTVTWNEGFVALEKFKAREGHCRVKQTYREGAFRLGQWVANQRASKEKLASERKQRLDAIGFEWDPLTVYWEEGFAALEKFRAREGNCRVKQTHREGSFRLGQWVAVQRRQRETTPAARKARLDTLGFVWRLT